MCIPKHQTSKLNNRVDVFFIGPGVMILFNLGLLVRAKSGMAWRIKSSPRTNIFKHSFLSMNYKGDDGELHKNYVDNPLKPFLLKQENKILNEGMKNEESGVLMSAESWMTSRIDSFSKTKYNEYSLPGANSEHIVKENSNFIPRENVADEIVQCMKERKRDGHGGFTYHNHLIALIGSPGMGKSTFLTHFPESEAYKRYLNGRSPIVSTVTYSNMAPTVGVEAIGLRIIYGAAVSMGILDKQSYPWELFYNTFISTTVSWGDAEEYNAIELLQEIFGENRPILILVDDLSKSSELPCLWKRDAYICSSLGYLLNGFLDLDVIVSSVSPSYINDVTYRQNRPIDYVSLTSMIDTEFGMKECQEWADALIDEMGVNDTIPDETKYLLRNVYLLYSGHPRSIEGMITAFKDPANSQKWTDLGKLCVTESIVRVLFQLVADLPLDPNCEISNLNEQEIHKIIFSTHSRWNLNDKPLRKLFQTGQIFTTKFYERLHEFNVEVQTLPLLRLLIEPEKYFNHIKGAYKLFHNLNNVNSLDVLFKRIVDYSIVSRSYERWNAAELLMIKGEDYLHCEFYQHIMVYDENEKSDNNENNNNNDDDSLPFKYDYNGNINALIHPSTTKNGNGVPIKTTAGYDRLIMAKSDGKKRILHFYLNMKISHHQLSVEDLPTAVGSMVWHCLSDYYRRNPNRINLSSFYIVLYVWEEVGETSSFQNSVTRDSVREAARHTAKTDGMNQKRSDKESGKLLRAVNNFIDNYFHHIYYVGTDTLKKSLTPSFLPLVRLIAATKE
eukprot:gene4430-8829_t